MYLGSTITNNLSIDSELNKRIGKAAMTLSMLTKRVWSNNKLSDHSKVNVHKAFGSALCFTKMSLGQCVQRILEITWQDKMKNKVVLKRLGYQGYTLS